MLADSVKLYAYIRKISSGDKRIALDANYKLWGEKIKSDCNLIGFAFNEWKNEYSLDTDFQIAACRQKVAAQEFEFYKSLTCPDDMETSAAPKCAAIQKVLGAGR
ncbi:hypothetical protein [Paraburkholderia oxyphila]|uniref:hypothetical protein n=1 Tax=Paraburkholderia oxyphila TaxID=614212 RepID=UPI000481EB00|nr:hypothetical protein [Paraburkholderia oxyphila]